MAAGTRHCCWLLGCPQKKIRKRTHTSLDVIFYATTQRNVGTTASNIPTADAVASISMPMMGTRLGCCCGCGCAGACLSPAMTRAVQVRRHPPAVVGSPWADARVHAACRLGSLCRACGNAHSKVGRGAVATHACARHVTSVLEETSRHDDPATAVDGSDARQTAPLVSTCTCR